MLFTYSQSSGAIRSLISGLATISLKKVGCRLSTGYDKPKNKIKDALKNAHLPFLALFLLTESPLGPGKPIFPGCPLGPVGPLGPTRPSCPEGPWQRKQKKVILIAFIEANIFINSIELNYWKCGVPKCWWIINNKCTRFSVKFRFTYRRSFLSCWSGASGASEETLLEINISH